MGRRVRQTTDRHGLYWVAIRGAAVPSWLLPVSAARMRGATVNVGESPGEPTLWMIPGLGEDVEELPGLRSNFGVLVGYRTAERQREAVATFLNAPIDIAYAELRRAAREEVVIRGSA
jgi:hypothetical protein